MLKAVASSPFQPHWMWGASSRVGDRKVRFFRILDPLRISRVFVRRITTTRFYESTGRRLGEARFAGYITVGISGRKGAPPASVPDVDILGLLRKGASEALGGELDFLFYVPYFGSKGSIYP